MAHRRLIWKVAPGYVLAILLCTMAVAWFAGEAVRGFYLSQTERELENKARLIAPQLSRALSGKQTQGLQDLCRSWGDAASVRLTIIDRSGRVLGDSKENPAVMDNHANRPEVIIVLNGKPGRSTRYSQTLNTQTMYVAQAVEINGQTVAVIRTAVALSDVQGALRSVYSRIALGGLVMATVGVALTLIVFHRHPARVTGRRTPVCRRRFRPTAFRTRVRGNQLALIGSQQHGPATRRKDPNNHGAIPGTPGHPH